MFGGLELKGSAGTTPATSQPPDESTTAPAASAFSFLMGNTATPSTSATSAEGDVTAAAPTSAFSFLTSPGPLTVMESAGDTATTGTTSMIPSPVVAASADDNHRSNGASSFNFMTTTTTVGTDTTTKAASQEIPPSSSFDFLKSIPSTANEVTPGEHLHTSSAAPATNTSSVFDFMSTTIPNVPVTGTAAPAGTGIVFGNAAVAPKTAVKKRTRTAKIGPAAQPMELPAPPPPPQMAKTPPTSQVAPPNNSVEVRDAALAATRRAEEFLKSKQDAEAAVASSEAMLHLRSVPSEEDDIIIAAKAAAKEAQKLSAKSHSVGGGAFSSLFRARSTTKTTPDSVSFSSTSQPQPGVSLSTSSTSLGSTDPIPVESFNRFRKDHDEGKRTVNDPNRPEVSLEINGGATTNDHTARITTDHTSAFVPPSIPTSSPRSLMKSFAKPTPSVALDVLSTPKQKTPTDLFNEMLQEFRDEVVQSMNEVTRLRQHRAGLLEERFVTNAKERLAVQQMKQAELHQITAAENEDFDLADQMSATIDRYSREQAEYSAILDNIGRAILELDRQKVQFVENVTNCFVNIRKRLNAFQKEQESTDTKNASEALSKFTTASKQLSIEQERLQNDLKHIERDAELIADERKELEKAISEQSGEYEKLRDQARSRLAAVEDEIEELRKQLQQKQKEAAELRTEAAGHDESVLKVRVKFARQLTRLQKKEMTIKDNKEEWEAEKRSFETNKQLHDTQVQEHSEAMLARDSLLDALGKEIELSDTFASIVAKEIGFDVNAGNDEPECDNELAQMQANVVKCEAAVSDSKLAVKTVVTILKNLEEEIQGLETQIPLLEDIKRRAAEKRDFKGASKASKEIKEATTRLTECKEELENEIISRKATAESELARLEEELDMARGVATEMERESGMATMTRLADNIKRLVATKESVCGSSNELSVSGVGAFVLEAQIKVLMMEGQAYGDKYGCWNELLSDVNLSQSDNPIHTDTANTTIDEKSTAPTATDAEDSLPERETNEAPSASANGGTSLEAKMLKFRDVSNRLKQCEDQLEASVAQEDFEKAAELDEMLQQLLAEVQDLNMTDEEMEIALTNSIPDDTQTNTEGEPTASDDDPRLEAQEGNEAPELPVEDVVENDSSSSVGPTPQAKEEEAPVVEEDVTPHSESDSNIDANPNGKEAPASEADKGAPLQSDSISKTVDDPDDEIVHDAVKKDSDMVEE